MTVRDTRELFCVTFMTQSGFGCSLFICLIWLICCGINKVSNIALPYPLLAPLVKFPSISLPSPAADVWNTNEQIIIVVSSAWDQSSVASWVIRTGRFQSLAICIASEGDKMALKFELHSYELCSTWRRFDTLQFATRLTVYIVDNGLYILRNHKTQTHSCTVYSARIETRSVKTCHNQIPPAASMRNKNVN